MNTPYELTRKARREIRLTGATTVRCPKCGMAPIVKTSERNERIIVTCPCRYVHEVEIVF